MLAHWLGSRRVGAALPTLSFDAAPVPARSARTAGAGALATLRSNYNLQQEAVRDSYEE